MSNKLGDRQYEDFIVPPDVYEQLGREQEQLETEMRQLEVAGMLEFDRWNPEDDYNDELDRVPYEKPECNLDLNNIDSFECDSSLLFKDDIVK